MATAVPTRWLTAWRCWSSVIRLNLSMGVYVRNIEYARGRVWFVDRSFFFIFFQTRVSLITAHAVQTAEVSQYPRELRTLIRGEEGLESL